MKTEILPQRAVKPKTTNQPTDSFDVCRLGHHHGNEPTRACKITASDQNVRAVYNCTKKLQYIIFWLKYQIVTGSLISRNFRNMPMFLLQFVFAPDNNPIRSLEISNFW